MNIKKILKQKNSKYKIYFDTDSLITYDDVIIKNNLLYKKSIDESMYSKIIDDTMYYDIYNKCIKFIDKRIRSEAEVRKYLLNQEISNETVDDIINKLKSINLINDTNYAKAYINDKLNLSNYGINKIKSELLSNSIDISIINSEIECIDYSILNNKLKKLINKKMINNNKYSSNFLRKKVLNDMILLGYEKEDVISIINSYSFSDDSILKKEFNKLNSRYNDNQKIIQKLLYKGFNYQNIIEFINKKKG